MRADRLDGQIYPLFVGVITAMAVGAVIYMATLDSIGFQEAIQSPPSFSPLIPVIVLGSLITLSAGLYWVGGYIEQ